MTTNKTTDFESMGVDQMDEQALRRLFAREAIQIGKLPGRRADRVWGGLCFGACTVCGLSFAPEELGYEVEFSEEGHRAAGHRLHIQCFEAWESECRKTESARSGNGARQEAGDADGAKTANGHGYANGRERTE
jgi:hypothetical protein